MSSLIAAGQLIASALGTKKLTRIAIVDDVTQFLELEATVSADHEGTATITKHPVEQGTDVADHIRREPETVQIDGIVSDTPILLLASFRAKPSVPGGNPKTRAVDAYEFLRGIKNQGRTVKLSTKLRDYKNMALSSLGVTQDKDTGNIVRLQIGFEEIVVATTQTKAAPDPVNAARAPKADLGKKPMVPATPSQSSVAFDLFSSFGG